MPPTAQDLQRWQSYKRQDTIFNSSILFSAIVLWFSVFAVMAFR